MFTQLTQQESKVTGMAYVKLSRVPNGAHASILISWTGKRVQRWPPQYDHCHLWSYNRSQHDIYAYIIIPCFSEPSQNVSLFPIISLL